VRLRVLPPSLLLVVACLVCQTGCGRNPEGVAKTSGGPPLAPSTWLQLDWEAQPFPTDHLSIGASGAVAAVLQNPRKNGCVGTFEMRLAAAQFTALKEAVRRADLHHLYDKYPPPPNSCNLAFVRIAVQDARGHKVVLATDRSYPRRLKPLFDPDGDGGGGILDEVASRVAAHPVAAISARIDVPKRSFRAGERINAAIIIKSVGTQTVVLPSLDYDDIGYGYFHVALRHVPPPPEELASGLDSVGLEFGPDLETYRRPARRPPRINPQHVVHIEPRREWRIPMPKPLIAPSAGNYELAGQVDISLLYERSALVSELGEGLISGRLWLASVPLTISE
jgi:hypothetical protein